MDEKIKLISAGSEIEGLKPGACLTVSMYCENEDDCKKLQEHIGRLLHEVTEPIDWNESRDAAGLISSADELRKAIVRGIDSILDAPFVSRFLSHESRRILRAQRNYWQQDDGTQLIRLLSLFQQEP